MAAKESKILSEKMGSISSKQKKAGFLFEALQIFNEIPQQPH